MKEFEVTITETLQKSVTVEAATREEAQAMSYETLRISAAEDTIFNLLLRFLTIKKWSKSKNHWFALMIPSKRSLL